MKLGTDLSADSTLHAGAAALLRMMYRVLHHDVMAARMYAGASAFQPMQNLLSLQVVCHDTEEGIPLLSQKAERMCACAAGHPGAAGRPASRHAGRVCRCNGAAGVHVVAVGQGMSCNRGCLKECLNKQLARLDRVQKLAVAWP